MQALETNTNNKTPSYNAEKPKQENPKNTNCRLDRTFDLVTEVYMKVKVEVGLLAIALLTRVKTRVQKRLYNLGSSS